MANAQIEQELGGDGKLVLHVQGSQPGTAVAAQIQPGGLHIVVALVLPQVLAQFHTSGDMMFFKQVVAEACLPTPPLSPAGVHIQDGIGLGWVVVCIFAVILVEIMESAQADFPVAVNGGLVLSVEGAESIKATAGRIIEDVAKGG